MAKRNMKPEVRKAQREQAIKLVSSLIHLNYFLVFEMVNLQLNIFNTVLFLLKIQ